MLYAILERGDPLTDRGVLDGRALQAIEDDELVAVVGEAGRSATDAGGARLWEYERVIEALMGERTLLPARFGSVFADATSVRASIREHRAQLKDALRRVSGAVELAVSASARSDPPVTRDAGAGPGTAYMTGQLERWQRARRIAEALEPLNALARAVQPRRSSDAGTLFGAAYLVDRDAVPRFVELLGRIDRGLEEAELTCTGPWPPFSFAGQPLLQEEGS